MDSVSQLQVAQLAQIDGSSRCPQVVFSSTSTIFLCFLCPFKKRRVEAHQPYLLYFLHPWRHS